MAGVLDSHDALVRRHVDRFLGRAVNTTGDEFDAPGRAIRFAIAGRDELAADGLDIRAGIHTGEVKRRATDIGGIAADIAARVEAGAEPGEVLVSRTVHDLLAGSTFTWTDRGFTPPNTAPRRQVHSAVGRSRRVAARGPHPGHDRHDERADGETDHGRRQRVHEPSEDPADGGHVVDVLLE